jgi:hypothetical protein
MLASYASTSLPLTILMRTLLLHLSQYSSVILISSEKDGKTPDIRIARSRYH